MLDNLRRDTRRLREIKTKPFPFYVIESLLFENGYQAVVSYRLASWFKHRGIPLFGPLFARLGLFSTGVDISPGAGIGPGLLTAWIPGRISSPSSKKVTASSMNSIRRLAPTAKAARASPMVFTVSGFHQ